MEEDIINMPTASIWLVIGNLKLFLYFFPFLIVTIHYFCYEGESLQILTSKTY